MTLESFFTTLMQYRTPIIAGILIAPWIVYGFCYIIPGKREESFLLSINLGVSLLLLISWAGYMVYVFSGGGIRQIVREADVVLLLLPIYHVIISLWLSRKRLPLNSIPAFRIMKGLGMMSVSFMALMWIASRVRIVFFSYLPFSAFLYIAGALVGIGYIGYRYLMGQKR